MENHVFFHSFLYVDPRIDIKTSKDYISFKKT